MNQTAATPRAISPHHGARERSTARPGCAALVAADGAVLREDGKLNRASASTDGAGKPACPEGLGNPLAMARTLLAL
jgi:hypothetical protein